MAESSSKGGAVASAALVPIYEVKNTVTGDQFIIYAPADHDDEGMFIAAHVTGAPVGSVAAPRILVVHPDDIGEYATDTVRLMRAASTGFAAIVWTNNTAGELLAQLPQ
ncbi:hypothetical protein [Nocardia terpenica]|uniref:Uncharacterized protein n=1 Tax=Nocardia terpenica TaxID=455432 RepID=A0A164JCB2_9NOCA|nr:hypothetical protein [Nocardia terpenica]KZM70263.1 hypothetical protein AWN90_06885 [Nocardia terpenica]NQE91704.1 hypothetical protein [Nocardia terpenica]